MVETEEEEEEEAQQHVDLHEGTAIIGIAVTLTQFNIIPFSSMLHNVRLGPLDTTHSQFLFP